MSNFIQEMIPYDYVLFGTVFSIFILLIVLGIFTRNKHSTSIFIFILAFSILLIGPTLGYVKMHEYIFKNSISITDQKKLTYTKALVVHGVVKNISNVDFSMCNIKVSAYKVSGNAIKDYIVKFNPFKETSVLEYDIYKGQEREFKIIVEPFTYSKDYNISIGAKCR